MSVWHFPNKKPIMPLQGWNLGCGVIFLWPLHRSNHDHSALKAMLQTLSANGKRVRW